MDGDDYQMTAVAPPASPVRKKEKMRKCFKRSKVEKHRRQHTPPIVNSAERSSKMPIETYKSTFIDSFINKAPLYKSAFTSSHKKIVHNIFVSLGKTKRRGEIGIKTTDIFVNM